MANQNAYPKPDASQGYYKLPQSRPSGYHRNKPS
ncbi:MAG: hypothetical protein Q609_ECAC01269G0001, partial [Escherichia coli DORA_A_5_14_21]